MPHVEKYSLQHDRDPGSLKPIIPARCGSVTKQGKISSRVSCDGAGTPGCP